MEENRTESRFERILRQHQENLEVRGHSPWIPIAHLHEPDGSIHVTTLKNPVTGEVISNA